MVGLKTFYEKISQWSFDLRYPLIFIKNHTFQLNPNALVHKMYTQISNEQTFCTNKALLSRRSRFSTSKVYYHSNPRGKSWHSTLFHIHKDRFSYPISSWKTFPNDPILYRCVTKAILSINYFSFSSLFCQSNFINYGKQEG